MRRVKSHRVLSPLSVVFFAATVICGCRLANSTAPSTPPPRKIHPTEFQGWACAPDAMKAFTAVAAEQFCKGRKKEWLYMPVSARNGTDIPRRKQESVCRAAARLQIRNEGLAKHLGEHLEKNPGISDGQSIGVAIISQYGFITDSTGIHNCCAIDVETGKCTAIGKKEDWNECQCGGYVKFPGGEKGLAAAVKKIQASP